MILTIKYLFIMQLIKQYFLLRLKKMLFTCM